MKTKHKLTDKQWNALQKLLSKAGLDGIFYLSSKGKKDFIYAEDPDKDNKYIKLNISKGCEEIIDSLGLSLKEEGLKEEEIHELILLWEELDLIDDDKKNWLLSEDI